MRKAFCLDHPLSSKNRIYIWRAQWCFMRFVLNCSLLGMPLLLYLRCAECGNVVCLFIHVGYKNELEGFSMVEQYLNLYLFLQVILNLMGNQEEKDYLIAD